ncbi:MAG: hypothetical protein V1709_09965 [Planctomycetota bacterium]
MNKIRLIFLIIVLLQTMSLIPVIADVVTGTNNAINAEQVIDSPSVLIRSQVYAVEKKRETLQTEINELKQQIIETLKNKQLEKGKELNDKVTQLEKSLKDIRVELDRLVNNYHEEFSSRSWWQKLMIEIGPQCTYFDNNIKINDVVGYRLRVNYRQETFGRYNTYPLIATSDSTLREVTSSPFIIEYRYSEHKVDNQKKKAQVDTYLAGFGLSGQLYKRSFIHLSIMGGLQDYYNTNPDDISSIFSYSMGLNQYLSDSFALGLITTEDWVLTKATQVDNKTISCFNFSLTIFARLKF